MVIFVNNPFSKFFILWWTTVKNSYFYFTVIIYNGKYIRSCNLPITFTTKMKIRVTLMNLSIISRNAQSTYQIQSRTLNPY